MRRGVKEEKERRRGMGDWIVGSKRLEWREEGAYEDVWIGVAAAKLIVGNIYRREQWPMPMCWERKATQRC